MRGVRGITLAQMILFGLYNAAYVAYMSGRLSQAVYFALLITFAASVLVRLSGSSLEPRLHPELSAFRSESHLLIWAMAFMVAFSAVVQLLASGTIHDYLLREVAYLVLPLLVALVMRLESDRFIESIYLGILLARYVTHFFIEFADKLSWDSIAAISWGDSISPFESSYAHDLLVLEVYFLYRRRTWLALVTMLLVMLSLKRASFVLALVLFAIAPLIRKMGRPPKAALLTAGLVGVLSPFATMWLFSASVVRNLWVDYALDLNALTSGRVQIYEIVRDQLPGAVGLGSINNSLGELTSAMGTTWNSLFHNDALRLYLETSALGWVLFVVALLAVGRSTAWGFLLSVYTLFVLVTSRLVTHLSYWIVLYMVLTILARDVDSDRSAVQGS